MAKAKKYSTSNPSLKAGVINSSETTQKNNSSTTFVYSSTLQKFSIAFIAAMFFPRVIPEGMFFDGLLYASIGRNIAMGEGSFWQPIISSSYTIPQHINSIYFYGHPPLAFGIISIFYKILGDHWWVEKLFCVVVWCITVFLVRKLWLVSQIYKSWWWLVLIAWYMSPAVLWSYPYFILDNLMTVFSLAAVSFELSAMSYELPISNGLTRSKLIAQSSKLITSCALLHLAFLTKGPVGLYPLAIPLIYFFCFDRKNTLKKGFSYSLILTLVTTASLGCWYFYLPARNFFQNYFHTQLMSSITDNEHTVQYTFRDYTLLYENIGLTLIPVAVVVLPILFLGKFTNKLKLVFNGAQKRWALFYFLVALSGSLPMAISHKTSWYYLLPCSPFFAFAGIMLVIPSLVDSCSWLVARLQPHEKLIANFSRLFIIGVIVFCFSRFGKIERERDLILDIRQLENIFPKQATITVSNEMMNDYEIHGYFQRYGRWQLAHFNPNTQIIVTKKEKTTAQEFAFLKQNHFVMDTMPRLILFDLYKRL